MIGYITLAAIVCFIGCLTMYHLEVRKYIHVTEQYFKRKP